MQAGIQILLEAHPDAMIKEATTSTEEEAAMERNNIAVPGSLDVPHHEPYRRRATCT